MIIMATGKFHKFNSHKILKVDFLVEKNLTARIKNLLAKIFTSNKYFPCINSYCASKSFLTTVILNLV